MTQQLINPTFVTEPILLTWATICQNLKKPQSNSLLQVINHWYVENPKQTQKFLLVLDINGTMVNISDMFARTFSFLPKPEDTYGLVNFKCQICPGCEREIMWFDPPLNGFLSLVSLFCDIVIASSECTEICNDVSKVLSQSLRRPIPHVYFPPGIKKCLHMIKDKTPKTLSDYSNIIIIDDNPSIWDLNDSSSLPIKLIWTNQSLAGFVNMFNTFLIPKMEDDHLPAYATLCRLFLHDQQFMRQPLTFSMCHSCKKITQFSPDNEICFECFNHRLL